MTRSEQGKGQTSGVIGNRTIESYEDADVVSLLESKIAERVGPQRFNVWFRNATRFAFTEESLRISAPNHFVGEWIERHFSDDIGAAVREILGKEFTLSFAIEPSLAEKLGKKQPDRQVDYVAKNPARAARQKRRSGAPPRSLMLRGRLEDFVVGPSNQLAYAAAKGIIESPGANYRSLFVHGGCGLGKTTLIQAICNGLKSRHPDLHWRYVTGEEFTNDFVYSVKAREQDAFRDRYRRLDVLVIDDVHFFASKKATQEEFLHTFQAIDASGKQIILASDAHPKMMGHFSEKLVSRFVAGMVVRIEPPDLDVRRGVLRQKADMLKVTIDDAVIEYLAEHFRANIRELEGALLKVVAQAQVMGQPITMSLAARAIRDLIRQTAPVVMFSDIESIVAIYFGLTPADLHTSRKTRTIALARGITMYLARKHTDMSFPEIGRFMGRKNHSTVILARRRISKMLAANEVVRWMTPSGEGEERLATLIQRLEESLPVAVRRGLE